MASRKSPTGVRKAPPAYQLQELRDQGKNNREIREFVREEYGQEIAENTISTVLAREGKGSAFVRYDRTIPWRLDPKDDQRSVTKILRWLAQRLDGKKLTAEQDKAVDNKLTALAADNAAITYFRNRPDRWYYVDIDDALKNGGRQPDPEIPIVIFPGQELGRRAS